MDPWLVRTFIGLENMCAFHSYVSAALLQEHHHHESASHGGTPCTLLFSRALELWERRMARMNESLWPHCQFSSHCLGTAQPIPGAASFHVF